MELNKEEFKKMQSSDNYYLGVGRIGKPPVYFDIYTSDFEKFEMWGHNVLSSKHARCIGINLTWGEVCKLIDTWPCTK